MTLLKGDEAPDGEHDEELNLSEVDSDDEDSKIIEM